MLKEIAGTRAYNILKKRKMETVEDVCQLFPSKYYDFSFINPLNTGRLDKNYAFVCKLVSYELKNSPLYILFAALFKIYIRKMNYVCLGSGLQRCIMYSKKITVQEIHVSLEEN